MLYIGENENKQRLTKEIVSVSFAKHDLSNNTSKSPLIKLCSFIQEINFDRDLRSICTQIILESQSFKQI